MKLLFKKMPIWTGSTILYLCQVEKVRMHNREVKENWIDIFILVLFFGVWFWMLFW